MRNEAGFIGTCLDCVVAFDWPKDRLEVLVLDGQSSDGSAAIVQEFSQRYPWIRLVPNPDRIQAAAFNRALGLARGDFFVRLDSHTSYESDYLSACIRLLMAGEAENVGGPQRPMGLGYVDGAIALAYQSRFAAGDAAFRYANNERWVDTVYLGAWRTDTLRRLGGMNEGWLVNEDYELNYRLRRAGGRILLSPTIRSRYWVRPSLPALARQYFRYGLWRARTFIVHPGSLRPRQLAAPLLVIALAASAALASSHGRLAMMVPLLYLSASLFASALASARGGVRFFPMLPLVFVTIHLAWGSGFLAGLLRWLPLSWNAGTPSRPAAAGSTEPRSG